MDVEELSREQLRELKHNYYNDNHEYALSLGEILMVDEIVSDEEVFQAYKNTVFFDDDFFCSAE